MIFLRYPPPHHRHPRHLYHRRRRRPYPRQSPFECFAILSVRRHWLEHEDGVLAKRLQQQECKFMSASYL